jgi:hypothetical protein
MLVQDEEKTLQAYVKKHKRDTSQLGPPEKIFYVFLYVQDEEKTLQAYVKKNKGDISQVC